MVCMRVLLMKIVRGEMKWPDPKECKESEVFMQCVNKATLTDHKVCEYDYTSRVITQCGNMATDPK